MALIVRKDNENVSLKPYLGGTEIARGYLGDTLVYTNGVKKVVPSYEEEPITELYSFMSDIAVFPDLNNQIVIESTFEGYATSNIAVRSDFHKVKLRSGGFTDWVSVYCVIDASPNNEVIYTCNTFHEENKSYTSQTRDMNLWVNGEKHSLEWNTKPSGVTAEFLLRDETDGSLWTFSKSGKVFSLFEVFVDYDNFKLDSQFVASYTTSSTIDGFLLNSNSLIPVGSYFKRGEIVNTTIGTFYVDASNKKLLKYVKKEIDGVSTSITIKDIYRYYHHLGVVAFRGGNYDYLCKWEDYYRCCKTYPTDTTSVTMFSCVLPNGIYTYQKPNHTYYCTDIGHNVSTLVNYNMAVNGVIDTTHIVKSWVHSEVDGNDYAFIVPNSGYFDRQNAVCKMTIDEETKTINLTIVTDFIIKDFYLNRMVIDYDGKTMYPNGDCQIKLKEI